MWYRPLRPWLVVIGVGLHLGILIAFPIPFFGLTMLSLYVLVAPPEWFVRIEHWLRRRSAAPQRAFASRAHSVGQNIIRRRDPVGAASEHLTPRIRPRHKRLETQTAVAQAAGYDAYAMPAPSDRRVRTAQEDQEYVTSVTRGDSRPSANFGESFHGEAASDTEEPEQHGSGCILSSTALPSGAHTSDSANRRNNLRITAAFAVVAAVMQALLILETPVLGIKDYSKTEPPTVAHRSYARVKEIFYALTGISSHGVFLDHHFKGADRIIAVTYQRPDGSQKFLPMISEQGTARSYAFGRLWCNWVFRSAGKHCDLATIDHAVERYTAFWAVKNNVSLANASFCVLVKRLDTIGDWEPDFLRRQTEKPWQFAAKGTWLNNQFQLVPEPDRLK
jgi:hypothetical protein